MALDSSVRFALASSFLTGIAWLGATTPARAQVDYH